MRALSLILSLCAYTAVAQLLVDVEGSYIFSVPYNTVRIPAQGGTQFDLAHDLKLNQKSLFVFRARASYTIAQRHVISLLAAPLTIKSSGSFDNDVTYSGFTYKRNTPVEARYMFNSYRLTYRYLLLAHDKITFGLGITGKVRHADIALKSSEGSSNYPDLGFVPLINLYLRYDPTKHWAFLLEGDGLASRQGRAADFFGGVAYKFTEDFAIKAGYRVLEGGADVTRNYNFSWINYASVGVWVGF
ncbi:MAG TPA: hypothetical protein VL947_10080 [Cytophagales bacterium]|nr:hypothetical protein [Cytophagales bacterium]